VLYFGDTRLETAILPSSLPVQGVLPNVRLSFDKLAENSPESPRLIRGYNAYRE
jgi:hypothetical protein